MSDRQRQQKQRYLRENILQSDYDPEEFMDFCENDRGSVDIDSWSLYELQDIVRRFIKEKAGTADQFDGYQTSPQVQSPTKPSLDDWSSFHSHIPKVEQKKQVGLTSVDLDFLEMMGMSAPTKKQQPKLVISKPQPVVKPQFTSISSNIQKPKPKNPNQQFVKKMQNQNFIAVFTQPQKPLTNDPFAQLQKPQQRPSNNQQPINIPAQIQPISSQKKHSVSATTSTPITSDTAQLAKSQSFQPVIKPQRDYPSNSPQENFITEIKCKQINKNKLPADGICRITGHQIINPNVFVPNFVMYTVTTAPANVEVKRRMKDFQELRNMLKKLFPTTQIPYLQRRSRLSQTQPHVIAKQKVHIENFLNSLLMNPTLKCRILQDFLFCQNLDTMKKIFRQLQKAQRPKGIEDLWTTTGYVALNTNMANLKYMNQQQLYIDFVQNSFTKLKALYDQLIAYYQNTAKIIDEIALVYDQLKETTKVINQNFQQNLRFNTFEPMLGQVTYLHRQLSEAMQRQSNNIQTELRNMFKYEISNISTMKETIRLLTNIHEAYEKRNDKQSAKKQSYDNKKLMEYKAGAELPSKHITVLKYQSAYAQNQFGQQMCRYMDQLAKKLGARFQIFSTLQISINADMELVWRQFQQFVEKRQH